jgi:hypothetical protein
MLSLGSTLKRIVQKVPLPPTQMRIHVNVVKAHPFRETLLLKNGRGCCALP